MPFILDNGHDEEPIADAPVVAEVFRFDPSRDGAPRMQTYVVPYRRRMTIFTMLRQIYEHIDPTLAFRPQHCGIGICGTCRLRIGASGRIVQGCLTTLKPGDHVEIRPYNERKVIRDLVIDM
jgi:succinate dehydrogenase / fumarate reductase iron-sulfur subunit